MSNNVNYWEGVVISAEEREQAELAELKDQYIDRVQQERLNSDPELEPWLDVLEALPSKALEELHAEAQRWELTLAEYLEETYTGFNYEGEKPPFSS